VSAFFEEGGRGFGCDFLVDMRFRFWLFQDYCEELFTTETQRGYAATKTHNISRKGRKELNFRTWRSWRLGASKSGFSG
jgi:hypothetical protein